MAQLTPRSSLRDVSQRDLITAAARGWMLDTAVLGTLRAARDYAEQVIERGHGVYLAQAKVALPALLAELRHRAQQEVAALDEQLAALQM